MVSLTQRDYYLWGQGTGKSLAAKTIANDWGLPLLRLDFGRLFASLVGQSEQRVRKMIEIVELCLVFYG